VALFISVVCGSAAVLLHECILAVSHTLYACLEAALTPLGIAGW
jgi:hypothetical protein